MISCPVKDVCGIALVDKHLFNDVVLEFDGDDHGVILLVIDVMEIVVSEGGGHSASIMKVYYVVDD